MNRCKNNHRWDHCTKPRHIFLLLILTVLVITVIMYFLSWQNNKHVYWKNKHYYNFNSLMYNGARDDKFQGEKIVHLDLKGAPPKVSYYKKLFPLLYKLGATGLLIEYEDMFPYQGPLLKNISALNAYTLQDIQMILQLAEESRLSVIPLVQTFGHMEFALKLKEFEGVREVPEYPQVICPTNSNSLNIIMEMIDQVIKAHPGATKIHIGADEVWYIGVCEECIKAMSKFAWTKSQLFLEHVSAVALKIRNRYPHIRILMWDDEFREMSLKELKNSRVSSLIEPVIWKYSQDVYEALGPSLWNMYAEVFPRIWIASAFKGATGSNKYVTDINHHLQNHRAWMSIVSEYKHNIKFEGIFITGWQRYDHFAILCELLPVAIPSLALSLRLLLGYNESPLSPPTEVAKLLECEQPYGLMGIAFGLPKCSYPGGDILDLIFNFHQLQEEYQLIVEDSRTKGWMTDYNIDHSFSNPNYVESTTTLISSIQAELSQLQQDLEIAMEEVYDDHTIKEWVVTFINPFAKKVKKLWEAREKLLTVKDWPQRPLPIRSSDEI